MQQRSLTSHWQKKTLQSVPSESVQPRDSISYEDKKAIIDAKTKLLRERWELGDAPAPSPAASDPGPPLRVTTRGGSAALVASCLDSYSNTVANYET